MPELLTAAVAIIKVKGQPVGLMRNISINENITRVVVKGLGTIMPVEAPVTSWAGTLSCSFFEIDFKQSGIKDALRRDVGDANGRSQMATGNNQTNFEDQLVLDSEGVQLDLYKKIKDVIDPTTKLITPKVEPYAIISRCLIEGDGITVDEGNVSGRNQSFVYLDPIVRNP